MCCCCYFFLDFFSFQLLLFYDVTFWRQSCSVENSFIIFLCRNLLKMNQWPLQCKLERMLNFHDDTMIYRHFDRLECCFFMLCFSDVCAKKYLDQWKNTFSFSENCVFQEIAYKRERKASVNTNPWLFISKNINKCAYCSKEFILQRAIKFICCFFLSCIYIDIWMHT